jgi:hypothetical protein
MFNTRATRFLLWKIYRTKAKNTNEFPLHGFCGDGEAQPAMRGQVCSKSRGNCLEVREKAKRLRAKQLFSRFAQNSFATIIFKARSPLQWNFARALTPARA